jgi:hypothetical protein
MLEINEFQMSWSIEELIVAMDTSRKGFRSFHKNTDNQIVASTEIVCFNDISGSMGFPVSVSLIVAEEHVKLRIDNGTIFSNMLPEIMNMNANTLPAYIEAVVIRVLDGQEVGGRNIF